MSIYIFDIYKNIQLDNNENNKIMLDMLELLKYIIVKERNER